MKKALSKLVKDKVLVRPPDTKGQYMKPTGSLTDYIPSEPAADNAPENLIATCHYCGDKEKLCKKDDTGKRICRNCQLLKENGALPLNED